MSDRLDPDAARQILRRAAELEVGRPPTELGYERQALVEAAAEVGIGRHSLEQALAEHDIGLLARTDGPRGVLGPSRVVVTRTVPLTPGEAQERVRRWLGRQMLEVSERQERAEIWRPRADLAARVRRKIDARITKKVRLRNVDGVRMSAASAGARQCVVCLEAEFDDMRRGLTTGVVVVPAGVTPVLGATVGLLSHDIAFFIGSVPLAVALGGIGFVGARHTLANERDDARRVLELFLDELS